MIKFFLSIFIFTFSYNLYSSEKPFENFYSILENESTVQISSGGGGTTGVYIIGNGEENYFVLKLSDPVTIYGEHIQSNILREYGYNSPNYSIIDITSKKAEAIYKFAARDDLTSSRSITIKKFKTNFTQEMLSERKHIIGLMEFKKGETIGEHEDKKTPFDSLDSEERKERAKTLGEVFSFDMVLNNYDRFFRKIGKESCTFNVGNIMTTEDKELIFIDNIFFPSGYEELNWFLFGQLSHALKNPKYQLPCLEEILIDKISESNRSEEEISELEKSFISGIESGWKKCSKGEGEVLVERINFYLKDAFKKAPYENALEEHKKMIKKTINCFANPDDANCGPKYLF